MRSFRYLIFVLIISLSLGTTRAAFTYNDYVSQFTSATANLSQIQKKEYYLKIYNSISLLAIRNRSDAQKFSLYTSLKTYIKNQITSLGTSSSTPTSSSPMVSSVSGMTIPKVDLAKVRDTGLALHNMERSTKNLTPFMYSSVLEGTATTRANHLVDLGKTTHLRNVSDGYYSYDSIKQRFMDQGITFASKEENGQPLFTENLGRGYYTCKKADCTNDFIKAIKTSWTFFMSEKGKSYSPHYNAIIGNFTTIGLGVAISGKKYYLVTHYTQDLK